MNKRKHKMSLWFVIVQQIIRTWWHFNELKKNLRADLKLDCSHGHSVDHQQSDRGQEHQQDHASLHGRHVDDRCGHGHVSYYCDNGKQAVLPKGLPYGDKVCRQTILTRPFIKGLRQAIEVYQRSATGYWSLPNKNPFEIWYEFNNTALDWIRLT